LLIQREEEGTQFTADCRDKNSSMQSKGQRKISHLNKGEIQMKNENARKVQSTSSCTTSCFPEG
jgi:hypothetical protein